MKQLLIYEDLIGTEIKDITSIEDFKSDQNFLVIVTDKGTAIFDGIDFITNNDIKNGNVELDDDTLYHELELLDSQEYDDNNLWFEFDLDSLEDAEIKQMFDLLKRRGYDEK